MDEAEYRKLAAVEDRMWYFDGLHALIERALTAALEGTPGEILDAGCGTGGLIRRLAARQPQWRWTGVDVSPLACALTRSRTPAPVIEASVTALPFPAARFAAIVSADVLYHLDDDGAALQEAARVLQPGGRLIVNVPAYPWLWSYHDDAVQGRRRYRRWDLAAKVRAAGFRIEQATYWNTCLFPLIVARRKLGGAPASGSDVHEYAPAVERLGRGALALERAWLRTGARLPFGSSVFIVAAKPRDPRD